MAWGVLGRHISATRLEFHLRATTLGCGQEASVTASIEVCVVGGPGRQGGGGKDAYVCAHSSKLIQSIRQALRVLLPSAVRHSEQARQAFTHGLHSHDDVGQGDSQPVGARGLCSCLLLDLVVEGL